MTKPHGPSTDLAPNGASAHSSPAKRSWPTITAAAGLLAGGAAALWTTQAGLWDSEGPTVALQLAEQVSEPTIEVTLQITDDHPGVAEVLLQVDGGPPQAVSLTPGGEARLSLPTPDPDGPHTVRVTAKDAAWTPNITTTEATFRSDRTPPVLQWAMLPPQPAQGEPAALFLRANEPLHAPDFSGLDQARPFRPLDAEVWRVLVGIGVSTPTGTQPITVEARDALGNHTRCQLQLSIQSTEFPRGGTIRLSKKQVAARQDEAALAKMKADRTAAYTHVGPVALWSGAALRPIPGRRTSAFGRYRTYSDGRKKHHLGTDLANATGTPVRAALAGEVRASGWQHLFGHAVILHHGHGLTTSYNHLSERAAELGDRVEQGAVIGEVGSTGQSTGPHLHWGMQVGEVEVDPERWPAHGFALDAVAAELNWAPVKDCTVVQP